jgi:hypothetical protein
MANRNRTAGNNFERYCQKKLVDIFPNTLTSRNESRTLDALKVDLTNTDPFYFQCKSLATKADYHTLINEMPQTNNINVVLHRFTKKANTRFIKQEDYAILKMDDFINLIKQISYGTKTHNNTNEH